MNKSKYNQLKSIIQKTVDKSIIRRCIMFNPVFDQVDEIIKRYNILCKKNLIDFHLVAY